MSSPSSTSLNSQPSLPNRGSRAIEETPNRSYTTTANRRNPTVAQSSAAEHWARTIDDITYQVQEFRGKVEFLESQLEDIRILMQQRRVGESLSSPPQAPLVETDDAIGTSPPRYGALSPAPPSINQQPSRYQEEGEFLYCVRSAPMISGMIKEPCHTPVPQELNASSSNVEELSEVPLDRWVYETGVAHSTFSSMRRDGASE